MDTYEWSKRPGNAAGNPPLAKSDMLTIRIARELTAERALELLQEHKTFRVELADLAAAWNPASTKHKIYGASLLQYTQFQDGGINCTILN